MTPRHVLVDANVLASRTCLDWLFHFRSKLNDVFTTHASIDILAEALRTTRIRYPKAPLSLTQDRIKKIRCMLNDVFDPSQSMRNQHHFTGNDIHDYHVYAAAIEANADILLTFNNVSDFTAHPELEPFAIRTPDEFFLKLAATHPVAFRECVREQHEYWSHISTAKPLDLALNQAQCPRFADAVSEALASLRG